MLEFSCAGCSKRVQGDDAAAGMLVQCPACGANITVPMLSTAVTGAGRPMPTRTASSTALSEGEPPHRPDLPLGEAPHIVRRSVPYVIGGAIAVVAIGLLIVGARKTREAAARTQSIGNLKQ